MRRYENLRFVDIISRKCKHCGHTQPLSLYKDFTICGYCGNLVFRSEKAEFKYRLKERIKNDSKEK